MLLEIVKRKAAQCFRSAHSISISYQAKLKMSPRRFVMNHPRPEWVQMVHVRDLSQVNDNDVWAEMAKVTSMVHHSDVMIHQEATIELTDVSTQAELTTGNALRDIGFKRWRWPSREADDP